MSLQDQERALFDLLFDRDLRARFGAEGTAALSSYPLSRAELHDFTQVRFSALETDARMRVYMLLAQLCRELPVSFALAAAVPGADAQFRQLVDRELLDVPVSLRAATYGERLMDWLHAEMDSVHLQAQVIALVGAEVAMARGGGALRQLDGDLSANWGAPPALPEAWSALPASIAPHTCAVIVPQPFDRVQDALCPVAPEDLWRHLDRQPTTSDQLEAALATEEPRLLLACHFLTRPERCVPLLSRKRVEVSTGFAPLLRYLDGRNCIDDILGQLERSGATADMLPGIAAGFEELCRSGIVRLQEASG